MDDPQVRMQKFVASEKSMQATHDSAEIAWLTRLPQFAQVAEGIVNILHGVGYQDLAVHADQGRIRIVFGPRPCGARKAAGGIELDEERGAEAVFLVLDKKVAGLRRGFLRPGQPTTYAEFANLGGATQLDAAKFGHAVVDFLQWAATGDGCGSKRLTF